MKKTFTFSVYIMLSFALMSFQCSSDDPATLPSNNSEEIQQIISQVQSGEWIITYFYDTDSDETSNFSGYTFTFGNSGNLTASNGTNPIIGSWSVTDDSIGDDSSSSDDIDFNIFFAAPNFEDLNDDWDIISHSSTKIELIDVSGGNGGTDYLTFEKN